MKLITDLHLEVKNEWRYTSTSPNALMACTNRTLALPLPQFAWIILSNQTHYDALINFLRVHLQQTTLPVSFHQRLQTVTFIHKVSPTYIHTYAVFASPIHSVFQRSSLHELIILILFGQCHDWVPFNRACFLRTYLLKA